MYQIYRKHKTSFKFAAHFVLYCIVPDQANSMMRYLLIFSVSIVLFNIFGTGSNLVVSYETERCNHRNASCEVCTDDSSCFWCEPTQSCHTYDFIPKGCNIKWYVRQCTVAGYWFVIVIPCVAFVLLVFLVCCCWCCCCRNNNESTEERYLLKESRYKREKEKRRLYLEERNTERDEPDNSVLRSKYGLFNSPQSP